MATGPYHVTAKNSVAIAETIRYRHYKPDELEIAKEFIRQHLLTGTYYFDVYLTTDSTERGFEELGAEYGRMLIPSMLRIDAICEKDRNVYLIEFKDRLRPTGIGELLTYKKLYIRQFKPSKTVNMVYVYRDPDPTYTPVLEEHGIISYRVLSKV